MSEVPGSANEEAEQQPKARRKLTKYYSWSYSWSELIKRVFLEAGLNVMAKEES